jgi:hypothetical protein
MVSLHGLDAYLDWDLPLVMRSCVGGHDNLRVHLAQNRFAERLESAETRTTTAKPPMPMSRFTSNIVLPPCPCERCDLTAHICLLTGLHNQDPTIPYPPNGLVRYIEYHTRLGGGCLRQKSLLVGKPETACRPQRVAGGVGVGRGGFEPPKAEPADLQPRLSDGERLRAQPPLATWVPAHR